VALESHFETGTNGATIATTDPGNPNAWDVVIVGVAPSVCAYDNAQKHSGTLAAKLDKPSGGGPSELRWTTQYGTLTDHYGRAYIRITEVGTGTPAMIWHNSPNWRIFWNSDRTLSLQDAAFVTQKTSTTVIPVNQWVRLEWHVVHNATTGILELKIFLSADSTTPTETLTATNVNTGSTGSTGVRFRNEQTVGTIWFDDVVEAATSYPGPYLPSIQVTGVRAAATAAGKLGGIGIQIGGNRALATAAGKPGSVLKVHPVAGARATATVAGKLGSTNLAIGGVHKIITAAAKLGFVQVNRPVSGVRALASAVAKLGGTSLAIGGVRARATPALARPGTTSLAIGGVLARATARGQAGTVPFFPSTPIVTDPAGLADQNPLSDSGKWVCPIVVGNDNYKVVGGLIRSTSGDGIWNESTWNEFNWGAGSMIPRGGGYLVGYVTDCEYWQETEVVTSYWIYFRITNPGTASMTGYCVQFDWNLVQIFRLDPAKTLINSASITMAAGDQLGVRMEGTLIEAFQNHVAVTSISDATYASGALGSETTQAGVISLVGGSGALTKISGVRATGNVRGKAGTTNLTISGFLLARANAAVKIGGTKILLGGVRALASVAGKAGVVNKGRAIAGTRALATAVGRIGSTSLTIGGVRASALAQGKLGGISLTIGGVRALATVRGKAGVAVTGHVVVGVPALATAHANPGSISGVDHAVIGVRALATARGNAGGVRLAIGGARAPATGTARSGGASLALGGSRATATVAGRPGTISKAFVGVRATATAYGKAGIAIAPVIGVRALAVASAKPGARARSVVISGKRAIAIATAPDDWDCKLRFFDPSSSTPITIGPGSSAGSSFDPLVSADGPLSPASSGDLALDLVSSGSVRLDPDRSSCR
jgi:hypothetical protein